MGEDWVDDENLSREETLARFEALNPMETVGPTVTPLPGGGQFVTPVCTYGVVTEIVERTSGIYATPVSSNVSGVLQEA